MSYTPTNWVDGKAPALNADNLNKIENELVKLDEDVANLEKVVEKPDFTTTTETTIPNSYEGRLLIEEIGGKCQQNSTSGKNLLQNTATTQTVNGVTFTVNSDGSVTANGTATASAFFTVGTMVLEEKQYIINGCPSGGSAEKYRFMANNTDGNTAIWVVDYGSGEHLTGVKEAVQFRIMVGSGVTVSNLVFKPMLRLATITDATYEPYTNGASPNPSYPQEIKCVKGKNLLDCRGLATQTVNGVTFTPKYDGNGNLEYVEVNGTASDYAQITLGVVDCKANETYTLSGCPSDGGTKFWMLTAGALTIDRGSSGTFTCTTDKSNLAILLRVEPSVTMNHKFYPMIRKSSITDSTYVPYGLLRVKTHRKNLLKNNGKTQAYNGISFTFNNDGTIAVNGTSTDRATPTLFVGTLPKGKYVFSQGHISLANSASLHLSYYNESGTVVFVDLFNDADGWKAFTLTKDTEITVKVDVRNAGMTISNVTLYPMIEEGTVATDYEPYTESSVTLSQPIELNGIGDVKDVIEDGKVKKRIGEYTVPSTISVTIYDDVDGISRYRLDVSPKESDDENLLFEYFGGGYTLQQINASALPYKTCIYAKTLWFTTKRGEYTADEFKAFIVGKKVYYTLEKPATEELPIADQVALNNLKTYDGITYLEFDAEIEPTFKGEYGTSKVGGYTLEGMLAGRNGELLGKSYADRITALEATVVNNI